MFLGALAMASVFLVEAFLADPLAAGVDGGDASRPTTGAERAEAEPAAPAAAAGLAASDGHRSRDSPRATSTRGAGDSDSDPGATAVGSG